MSNDKTIEEYRTKIENKRKELGKAPKENFITNGIRMHSGVTLNLHVINLLQCEELLVSLFLEKLGKELVSKELKTELGCSILLDTISDVKSRYAKLLWEVEKKKLDAMDAKLAMLLSEEAKTNNAINEIGKELNLD